MPFFPHQSKRSPAMRHVLRQLLRCGVVCLAGAYGQAAPDASPVLQTEFIFEQAPFPSCHASTLAETPSGLLAAWFGGTAEGKPDVTIWLSRRSAQQWSAPLEVATGVQEDGSRHPCWNPVLYQARSGRLLLFYKVGPSPQRWWGMLMTSSDEGRTWSTPRRLPEGILGPIKNKPVQLANGDLLCGASTESIESPSRWQVHFERSSDDGATWTRTADCNDGVAIAAIQPSILFLGGEKLLAMGRTRQRRIFSMESPDQGKTWAPMRLTNLPNPNSGTDAVTLADGRHSLVYNHTEKGRSPLNLAISEDGETWQAGLVLESGPGEFSYPAIIQSRDGLLHVAYTWQRKRIKHVVIDPAKFTPRDLEAAPVRLPGS